MDENGIIGAFGGGDTPGGLNFASSSSVPTTQPDFDVAGAGLDAKAILTAASGAVTSIAGAVSAVNQARASGAIAAQTQAQTNANISTQGKIAQLQNASQLATAQAAFNKAAGVAQQNPVIVILSVASLLIGAFALWKGRTK